MFVPGFCAIEPLCEDAKTGMIQMGMDEIISEFLSAFAL
jgi:hypothetical protein